jgi:hypothetical protein
MCLFWSSGPLGPWNLWLSSSSFAGTLRVMPVMTNIDDDVPRCYPILAVKVVFRAVDSEAYIPPDQPGGDDGPRSSSGGGPSSWLSAGSPLSSASGCSPSVRPPDRHGDRRISRAITARRSDRSPALFAPQEAPEGNEGRCKHFPFFGHRHGMIEAGEKPWYPQG